MRCLLCLGVEAREKVRSGRTGGERKKEGRTQKMSTREETGAGCGQAQNPGRVILRSTPPPAHTYTHTHSMSAVAIEQTNKPQPSATIVDSAWDTALSNAIVKTGLGFGAGVVVSVLLFKRRAFPVWLGVGFGLGRSYAEADSVFRQAGLRKVDA